MQPGDQRVQQLSITPWCQQHVPSRGSAYHYSSILTNSKLVCQVVTQLGLLLLLPSNVPSLLPGGSLGNWQGCSIFAKSVASVLSVVYRCLGTLLTVSKSSTNSNTVKAISNKLKIFLEAAPELNHIALLISSRACIKRPAGCVQVLKIYPTDLLYHLSQTTLLLRGRYSDDSCHCHQHVFSSVLPLRN